MVTVVPTGCKETSWPDSRVTRERCQYGESHQSMPRYTRFVRHGDRRRQQLEVLAVGGELGDTDTGADWRADASDRAAVRFLKTSDNIYYVN